MISAHDDAGIRVSFSSRFDDAPAEGFRWSLDPPDDIDRIVGSVTSLLAECRVTDVHVAAAALRRYSQSLRLR